jgi:hypothetical protein
MHACVVLDLWCRGADGRKLHTIIYMQIWWKATVDGESKSVLACLVMVYLQKLHIDSLCVWWENQFAIFGELNSMDAHLPDAHMCWWTTWVYLLLQKEHLY